MAKRSTQNYDWQVGDIMDFGDYQGGFVVSLNTDRQTGRPVSVTYCHLTRARAKYHSPEAGVYQFECPPSPEVSKTGLSPGMFYDLHLIPERQALSKIKAEKAGNLDSFPELKGRLLDEVEKLQNKSRRIALPHELRGSGVRPYGEGYMLVGGRRFRGPEEEEAASGTGTGGRRKPKELYPHWRRHSKTSAARVPDISIENAHKAGLFDQMMLDICKIHPPGRRGRKPDTTTLQKALQKFTQDPEYLNEVLEAYKAETGLDRLSLGSPPSVLKDMRIAGELVSRVTQSALTTSPKKVTAEFRKIAPSGRIKTLSQAFQMAEDPDLMIKCLEMVGKKTVVTVQEDLERVQARIGHLTQDSVLDKLRKADRQLKEDYLNDVHLTDPKYLEDGQTCVFQTQISRGTYGRKPRGPGGS